MTSVVHVEFLRSRLIDLPYRADGRPVSRTLSTRLRTVQYLEQERCNTVVCLVDALWNKLDWFQGSTLAVTLDIMTTLLDMGTIVYLTDTDPITKDIAGSLVRRVVGIIEEHYDPDEYTAINHILTAARRLMPGELEDIHPRLVLVFRYDLT